MKPARICEAPLGGEPSRSEGLFWLEEMVGRDDNCLNPELAEFRAWDQVFGVLQDWNRSLVAQEPPKDGP